jgi:hypothetical protein
LLSIKKDFVRMRLEGIRKKDEEVKSYVLEFLNKNKIETTISSEELSSKIIDALYPIDIDEVYSTLYLPYCKANREDRDNILSYTIGELFFRSTIKYLDKENLVDEVFNDKMFPAGEINGMIFISSEL